MGEGRGEGCSSSSMLSIILRSTLQNVPGSFRILAFGAGSGSPVAAMSGNSRGDQSGSPAQAEPERFHSLDALRAFALLLGVLFHAAESFEPGVGSYWAVEDCSTSRFLGLVRHACHSFRMEIFFLIAGFFARLLWQRRRPRGFIVNRLNRILVPLVVGWLILYPLLVYVWILGMSLTDRLGLLGVPPDLTQTPPVLLTLGFFLKLQFVSHFDLTHLWFLHQLLVVYAVFLLSRWVWLRWLDRKGTALARVDRRFGALTSSRWSVVVLAAATAPTLMLMRYWGVDTPKWSLLPHPPTTLLFGIQFGVGWWLHRQPEWLDRFVPYWRGNLLLGVLLVLPTAAGVGWLRELGWIQSAGPGLRWVHSALYALMMWGFVLGFLGLFVRFRRHPSPRWRYIADSSYWIYLVHLPVVVALQILVARWPVHWVLKYPLVVTAAVPVLYLSYHYLVRSTFIGVQLNGRRYPIKGASGQSG
jgi:glucan biosynthesis protein C